MIEPAILPFMRRLQARDTFQPGDVVIEPATGKITVVETQSEEVGWKVLACQAYRVAEEDGPDAVMISR